jgi:hypothetical protein
MFSTFLYLVPPIDNDSIEMHLLSLQKKKKREVILLREGRDHGLTISDVAWTDWWILPLCFNWWRLDMYRRCMSNISSAMSSCHGNPDWRR